MNNEERRFEEVIQPEDRLNEELLDDILGGTYCDSGKIVFCTKGTD